jgi:hypothetical protein
MPRDEEFQLKQWNQRSGVSLQNHQGQSLHSANGGILIYYGTENPTVGVWWLVSITVQKKCQQASMDMLVCTVQAWGGTR